MRERRIIHFPPKEDNWIIRINMYAFLIDDTNRVISYQPTTYELIKEEVERPELPESPKAGTNYVEYWDEKEKKIYLQEESRPLTLETCLRYL